MPWYSFTPPGMGTPDPSNPLQYTNVGNTPPSCMGTDEVCSIQAGDSSGQPVFTTSLYEQIIRAQHNHTPESDVDLRAA